MDGLLPCCIGIHITQNNSLLMVMPVFCSITANRSWGHGLIYDQRKTDSLISGSNQDWYSFKSAIWDHMSCSSIRNGGQFHMKSLQHMFKDNKRKARNTAVNVKLVSAGIEVCKMKAAASHYESVVSLLSFCNADVGNIGHGR